MKFEDALPALREGKRVKYGKSNPIYWQIVNGNLYMKNYVGYGYTDSPKQNELLGDKWCVEEEPDAPSPPS